MIRKCAVDAGAGDIGQSTSSISGGFVKHVPMPVRRKA
jgi:hypothetical protein